MDQVQRLGLVFAELTGIDAEFEEQTVDDCRHGILPLLIGVLCRQVFVEPRDRIDFKQVPQVLQPVHRFQLVHRHPHMLGLEHRGGDF
jgi:hypothetical protein